METLWKVLSSLVVLFLFGLCNGLPINLENSGPDPHTQFLTGLVAVLLAICSVVLLAGCLCCQRNGFKEFRDSPVASSTTIIGSNQDHGHVNPIANSSSEFTIFTPISPPHHNNNVFLANQRIVSCSQEEYKDADIDASLWFDGSEKDFPRTKLKYIRELGKGWFGRVVEGTAQNISEDPGDPEWTPVVVRILEASATSRERLLFLNDAAIYKCGYHPHILRILGRSLDTVPLLLLQENCSQGDLKKYLRMCKSSQDKLVAEEMPLRWCYQLTLALKFLHDQKLTHPDLAARNCQLSEDLSLKLGDYGLSASYYPEDYYQGSPGVPLRWCAPEIIAYTSTTIQTTPTTVESNVWALGVTMWEILEWGEQPYSELTDDEVISHVLGTAKIRLPRPTYHLIYTDYMYKIMQSCWYNPESRITVSQIELMVTDLMHVYENTKISLDLNSDIPHEGEPISLEEFDMRWNALKPNSPLGKDSDVLERLKQNQNQEKQVRAQKSASMNNLHGSLDNLLDTRQFDPMESWLENVASDVSDMSFVRGLSEAITDLDNAIAMQNISSSPEFGKAKVTVGGQFTSSESETEDENWRKKIERGAYTEKVRQKSRSVADLMVLTHIDYSESDSETLPSLDYSKANQRVRYLKNVDNQKKFGSEGNLIHVHDNTFQEELKKLQEERRDSLLFVPDKFSECSFSEERAAAAAISTMPSSLSNNRLDNLENSPVKKLIEKLNSPSEMVPPQQVYNIFNVRVQHMNVSGTVCDKIGETVDRNINANSSDSVEKEGTAFSAICDRRLESKVLEQNMLILPSSDNQKSFSVDSTKNQNIEYRECPSHIKPFYNPFANAKNSSKGSYDGCIKKVDGQNVIFSKNCIEEETYPCKKVSSDILDSAYKINSTNEKTNNGIISNIFENIPYGKVKEENPMISPKQYNDILQRKELSAEDDTMKQNNFEVKIEILNEQNSTLNTHKNYNIMPNNLNNEISSKEILVTSKENSKNVKLKVPKLSEIIQRNAIDYKVHHHHSGSNDKTSVISKNEENEKLIHQDIVDKDSGLNTPENSASLEKLYDDNEEILDIGSFDSDRSNETNKGILLTELSNEEEHSSKGKNDEIPVLGFFQEEKREIGEEDEITKMIDYCVKKEAKLVCDLFLAHERSNYFADADDTLVIDSKAIELDSEVNKKSISCENIGSVIKKYSFLSYDYKNDMRNFIESEIYHTSTLLDYAILPNKLDNDIIPDVDVNASAIMKEDNVGCKYDRNSAIEDVVLTNQQLPNSKTSENESIICYTGSKAVSLNKETHYSFRINTDDKVPDKFDFIQDRNFSQQENLESTSGNEFNNIEERFKSAVVSFEKLNNNHTAKKDPFQNVSSTVHEVLSIKPDTSVNNSSYLQEIEDCQIQSRTLENQINAKTVDQIFNENDNNDDEISRRYDFDVVKIVENVNLSALENELKNEPVILEKLIMEFESNEENKDAALGDEKSYIEEKVTTGKIIDIFENSSSTVNEERNQNFMSKQNENIGQSTARCENTEISQTKSFLSNEIECYSSMCPTVTSTVASTNNPDNSILESVKTFEQVTTDTPSNKLEKFTFKDILTDQEDINSKEQSITENLNIKGSVLIDSAERIAEVTEHVQHSSTAMQENDLQNNTDPVDQLVLNTNCNLNPSRCTQFKLIEDEQLLPHVSNKEKLTARNSKTNACKFNQPSAILIDEVINDNDVTLKIDQNRLDEQTLQEQGDDIVNKKITPEVAGMDTEDLVSENNINIVDKTSVSSENVSVVTSDESGQNIQELNTGQSNAATALCSVSKLQDNIFESVNSQSPEVPSLVSYATIAQTATFLNVEILSYSKIDGDSISSSIVGPNSEFDGIITISGENKADHSLDNTQTTVFPTLGSEIISEIQELPVVAREEFQNLRDSSPVKLIDIESSSQIGETCKEIGDNQNLDVVSTNASRNDMVSKEVPKKNEHLNTKITQPLAFPMDEEETFALIDIKPKIEEHKLQQTSRQCEDFADKTLDKDVLIRDLNGKIKETANFLNNEIKNYQNFKKRIIKFECAYVANQLNEDLSVSEVDTAKILQNETRGSIELDDKLGNYSISNFSELEHLTDKADSNDVTNTVVVQNSEIDKSRQIAETFAFLKQEVENYAGNERKVDFDLSDTQEKISLNSLTHISTFTSTQFANRRPTDSTVILGASEDYSIDYYSGLKTSVDPEENADLQFSSNFVRPNNTNDLYSLETWDNFLGRSFDEQESAAVDFNDFSEEPHSLLFLECDNDRVNQTNELKMTKVLDETYDPGNVPPTSETFTKECEETPTATFDVSTNKTRDQLETDPWETASSNRSSGGWFLHPQSTSKDTPIKTQETVSTTAPEESYVGFSMDDEIMAAIRNELLTKLPHAQRASSDHQIEENCEEMDSAERNEVFLRYNVYNTPLSPIPEESCDSDVGSGRATPKRINDTSDEDGDSSDWSLQEDNNSSNARTEEIISPRIPESPTRCRTDPYRHTPSQDSCCSNDTLFNVEELNGGLNDKMLLEPVFNQLSNVLDSMEEETSESKYVDCDVDTTLESNEKQLMDYDNKEKERDPSELPIIKTEHSYILDFLDNERYGEMNMSLDAGEEVSSTSDIYLTVSENTFSFGQNVAPLNSPEDRPWKEIQASFRDCDEVELLKINSEEACIPQEHSADNSLNDTKLSLNAMDADSTAFQMQDTADLKDSPSFINGLGEIEELDDCLISDEDIDKVLREDMESEILNQNLQEEIPPNQSNSDFPLDERIYVNVKPDLVPANDPHGNEINLVTAEGDGLNNEEIYANLSNSEEQMVTKNKDDFYSPDDAMYVNFTKTEEENVASHPNTITDNRIYVNMTKTESGESFNTEDSCYSDSVDTFNRHQTTLGYENLKSSCCDDEDLYSKVDDADDSDKFSRFDDLFGPLTDIRFSGPGSSSQLMTTSFSESNDLGDDQEWDSGSDTRSSSSGEFIWKEGEHEASVKALRAPPQLENLDYVTAMENIQEEITESSKGISTSGSSSGSEGEDECPEFVPSAWDKYATPTKSALRSPEKTLQRSKEEKMQDQRTPKEKKSKGVWFKKQKYHCVYEYPREPESPVLQSYDLWKPAPDYATLSDWDLDSDPYLSVALSNSEILDKQPTRDNLPKNLYHLNTFTDINVDPHILNDEDFFVSSSSKPFDMLTGLTSQFFPGKQYPNDRWIENVNVTPDSGVEDITTPATFVDEIDGSYSNKKKSNSQLTEVQSLKVLAATAAERSGTRRELGGLRHTRSKLKLDLPPSPSAFTSNRTFSLDTTAEEIVTRQVPTFTTFGKSRFLVQHVDTPPDSGRADKNVSFEALPHKKPQTLLVDTSDWKHQKKESQKIESVRGEASLLDSADEDSGIESCTLDRRRFNI